MSGHAVVSRESWLEARLELLEREKALTRARDEVSRARRELPWVRVERDYRFEGESGPVSLADLFGGRSQLLVYHFMFGPEWESGCKSCSFCAEAFEGAIPHLAQRDVSFAVVSRAPLERLLAFRERMGWRFGWYSSLGNEFNFDFGVSFTAAQVEAGDAPYNFGTGSFGMEEAPGLSAFALEGGQVFHTYSTYARGLDTLISTYNLLDMAPRGRDEDGLPYTMSWVRLRDEYGV